MAVVASTTSVARLEPLLLLAKSTRGAGAAQLVQQATAAPGCYVFGELFGTEAIKSLTSSEQHIASHRLLEIFAFGTLSDYRQGESALPALNAAQLLKLKQLTLVSLASQARSLPYTVLLEQLEMGTDVRALEDLIIDAIYAGIVRGKLDQMRARFEVEGCLGRDVRGEAEISTMLEKLRGWRLATGNVHALLTSRINAVQEASSRAAAVRAHHEEKLARAFADLHKGAHDVNGPRGYDRLGADREDQFRLKGATTSRSKRNRG